MEALINDLFSHLAAVESYTNAWPLVGPDIDTSDNPDRVCVIIDPPPPDPPTDLNKPPGTIVKSVASVNIPSPFITIAPKYIALAAVLGA